MAPLLSIIVGTRDRQESLQRLVNSIGQYTPVDWELIIANASERIFGLLLTVNESRRTTVINEHPAKGFAAGYNAVCREAKGKWALILNDDCEVLPGYAETAIQFMERHPQIGLGALQYSNKGGPFKVNSNSFDGLVYANFPIISTELGNRIGWHDEICRMYGADNSLGFRVLLAGLGIAEIPNARILHHEHDDAYRHENLKGQQEDARRLREKYEPLLPQMRATYERCRMVTA